jgi:hypothetical protein
LVIVLMPLSEHLMYWDMFLHGGSDLEFGILCLLLFAGLVPLMAYRAETSLVRVLFWMHASPRRLLVLSLGLPMTLLLPSPRSCRGESPGTAARCGTPLRI